jgi:hypothetical protein
MDNAGQHWQPRVIEDMLDKGVVIIPLTPRDFGSSPPGECLRCSRSRSPRPRQLPAGLPRDLYPRVSMPLRDVQSARSTK